MSQRFGRLGVGVVAGICLLVGQSRPARAQSLGVGPRFSFVRGDVKAERSTRYSGGLLRMRTSPRTALEVSLDYHLNESLTERIKDLPIQGSLLMYPVRARLSPYFVGGIGWYSHRVEQLQNKQVLASTKTRTTGYHAGMGTDLWLGRRAALNLDYRYTFIGFGHDEDSEPGALPVPGTVALQKHMNLSHKGSMWATGVTVYF